MKKLVLTLTASISFLTACNSGSSTDSNTPLPGKFVLAGASGSIYSSLTSMSNVFYPSAILQNIATICGAPTGLTFGANKYVLVANKNDESGVCISQSTNAKNWDEFIVAANNPHINTVITTSDNKFILGGTSVVMSGYDLHNLKTDNFIPGKSIKKLLQNNSVIIALCSDNTVYYASSNDLSNWTQDINFSQQANSEKINDITVGNSYIMAVGTDAKILYTNKNNYPQEINWSNFANNLKTNQEIKFIAYGNGEYVGITTSNMLSNLGPTAFTIDEQNLNFKSVDNLQLNPVNSLAFGAGYFMLTAQSNGFDAGVNSSANSTDGINWNPGVIISSLPLVGIPLIRATTFGLN